MITLLISYVPKKKNADLKFFPPILAVMQNVGMTDKKLQIL